MAPGAGDPVFVLIHSPLVGPASWAPTAHELQSHGRGAVIPSLLGVADAAAPQWRQIPAAVRAATADIHAPIVLAGHSGGGLLLPAIADAVTREVAALVFVDSFLPPAAGSMPLAPPELINQLRGLATEGVLPPWWSWFGADAMRELVADDRMRAVLQAQMPRLHLSYFEARVPLPGGWTRCPCAYLLLSAELYRHSASEARGRGWPVAEITGGRHMATATEPVAVADALLDLERALDRNTETHHGN